MHGCSSGSALVVNAEVDSMGGVVDGGVGIGVKTSPRRAAIEKAQEKLRQEYDVREERRRELEFLEKGGNPLDFKFGSVASLSVQSTSLTDQHLEHFVTSEAKGSFALTASPHGDSVESSGRPGAPSVCEPNSADNLLLFDGENEILGGERKFIHPSRRNNVAPSEQSSQMYGSQNVKESEDSAIFRPYARRNRSRSNRDGARSSSTDIVQCRGGHGSSISARGGSRDAKMLISEINHQKDQNIPLFSDQKPPSSNGDMASKILTSDNQLDMESDCVRALDITTGLTKSSQSEDKLVVTASKSRDNQPSQVDVSQTPVDTDSRRPDVVAGVEKVAAADINCPPYGATAKADNETACGQSNGFSDLKGDWKSTPNEIQNSSAAFGTKGLDSESSCTQTSLNLDVNNDSDVCTNLKNVDSNSNPMEQTSEFEGTPNLAGEMAKEMDDTKAVEGGAIISDGHNYVSLNHTSNGSLVKVEEEIQRSGSNLQNEVQPSSAEGMEQNDNTVSGTDKKVGNVYVGDCNLNIESTSSVQPQGSVDISVHELPETTLSGKDSAGVPDLQTCPGNHLKLADKAHEESILEEARIIQAKHKRIAELSVHTLPLESRRKSQWDFVLEEMAWLANDFAQERLWKITVAAQISHRAAFTSRLRFEKQNQEWKLKNVAYTLAKAVMQFWHKAEVLLHSDDPSVGPKNCADLGGSRRDDEAEVSEDKIGGPNEEIIKDMGVEHPRKNLNHAVQGYAVRFLKYNCSLIPPLHAEAPTTPDRILDSGILEMSWEDQLTEESLFYTVPSGAMETYRKSIESHMVQCEKAGSSMQEEVETSMCDAVADFGYQDKAYDEGEGETSTYYLPFEGSKSSNFSHKKRKNLMKSYSARYALGADVPYGTQPSSLMGKRPANLNVGPIPTKRMRTASRQRVLSPFGGATGGVQGPTKTDASSGDTNSYQDDQSTLHGGSQIQKSVEVESVGDFEKSLPYDSAETSTKPKKKKKPKHLVHKNSYISRDTGGIPIPGRGSTYEQGWQLDSTVHNEQRDYSKKRLESHHFESNGTSGLYGKHNAKKLKIMKQSLDNPFDNITAVTGSIPSPVTSQMSNMSNPNKFIKLIGGRDRGRKTKKMSPGQPGSGSPWSQFEDQALVVLVHDMGPNWELVSDAINSTLQIKCIFRKPKECKERHKILMDRSPGDGADSAEDSGSSQSYPSTLPGIPKGSARQLFQRLQWPMEEDTLKSHFEKIITIGQKQHYRRSQNDNQDLKQIAPAHNSHVIALSQVCPNNLNGGLLTPLDLCDTTASSPDVISHGFQGSHASGLAISNQGAVASILSTSANSPLQGSPGMVLGNNLSSPSGPLNTSVRDARYGVPRSSSLPVDEQQRMQQYNQMLSSRNIQHSNLSVPGALRGTDRAVRMLPGGNGMGMMGGMNRSMSMSRPGFQGMASSAMLNSGSMLSSGMPGMPSPVNMHSGAGSGQGNSMMRPRDVHMMRPAHNPEHQRQMVVPELQVTQATSQGIPPFNGLSSSFSNQTAPPPVQTYPVHPQHQHQMSPQQTHAPSNPHHLHLQGPNHASGSQQQAYALRLAKERQLQQRFLQQQQQQQQQQLAASNALMPHGQPQPQLPMSTSLQNSSQIPSQTSSQPLSLPPLTPSSPMTPISVQHQQKHHMPSHGIGRNPQTGASGMTNQMGKQRQRQPQQQQFQQSGRHHPQQRQQPQSQQQAKLMKGIGRGNMVTHQNLNIDPSHLNGLSMAPGSQAVEKGEQIMHLMQGQGLYSGSGLNSVQQSKPLVPPQSSNQSQLQQKLFSGPAHPSSKQMPSHSDNSAQGQVPPVPSAHTLPASRQAVLPAIMTSNQQPQPQPHQKQVNQTQSTVQRMLQQNRQVNSDPSSKSQNDQAQADQKPIGNASQVGTGSALPRACIDSANMVPVVSSGVTLQWKGSETVYDSCIPSPATQIGSIGSPPHTNSAGNEPMLPASQGLGQRQLSSSLTPHGHNVGAQWQPQPHLQQSPTSPLPSQQHHQPQEQRLVQHDHQQQLPPQQQSQQQTQHLQAGQGNLYIRPNNSKLE